jgi:hypothetical protein
MRTDAACGLTVHPVASEIFRSFTSGVLPTSCAKLSRASLGITRETADGDDAAAETNEVECNDRRSGAARATPAAADAAAEGRMRSADIGAESEKWSC